MKKEKCFNKIFLFAALIILLSLSFVSASFQTYSVKVTNEHPFLLSDGEYIPASKLQEGMELKTINGKKARITKITDVVLDKPVNVYNLDTKEYDDFILPGGVVVHNSGKTKKDEFTDYLKELGFNNKQIERFTNGENVEIMIDPDTSCKADVRRWEFYSKGKDRLNAGIIYISVEPKGSGRQVLSSIVYRIQKLAKSLGYKEINMYAVAPVSGEGTSNMRSFLEGINFKKLGYYEGKDEIWGKVIGVDQTIGDICRSPTGDIKF